MSPAERSQASPDKRERLGMSRRFSESRDTAELRSDGTTADLRGRAPADALHGMRCSLQPGLSHCARTAAVPGDREAGRAGHCLPSLPDSTLIQPPCYISPLLYQTSAAWTPGLEGS